MRRSLTLALVLLVLAVIAGPVPAQAVPPTQTSIAIAPVDPATSPAMQPAGTPFQYRLAYSCQGCANTTISIPLGAAADFTFATVPSVPTAVVGGNLVLTLGDVNGSFDLNLVATPPKTTTPDGTTWTFTPHLVATELDLASATSVTGTASNAFTVVFTKTRSAATAAVGEQISFDLAWQCGALHAGSFTVKDVLPAGVDFVSATQGGTNSGGTVTWTLDRAQLGAGCGSGTVGKVTVVGVVTAAALGGQDSATLTNNATLDGTDVTGAAFAQATDSAVFLATAQPTYAQGGG